jgi:thioredoxin 1
MRNSRTLIITISLIAFILVSSCSRQDEESSSPQSHVKQDPLTQAFESNLPVLAEFGRGTCIACKKMKPILEEVSQEFEGRALVVTVGVDRYMNLTRKHRITLIPTQIFFDSNEKEVERHTGFMPKEEVVARLTDLCEEPEP